MSRPAPDQHPVTAAITMGPRGPQIEFEDGGQLRSIVLADLADWAKEMAAAAGPDPVHEESQDPELWKAAREVAGSLANEGLAIDPTTIALIIEAILAAIQVFQECRRDRTPEQIGAILADPSLIQEFRIQRAILTRLGAWRYLQLGGLRLGEAIRRRAALMPTDELIAFCDARHAI